MRDEIKIGFRRLFLIPAALLGATLFGVLYADSSSLLEKALLFSALGGIVAFISAEKPLLCAVAVYVGILISLILNLNITNQAPLHPTILGGGHYGTVDYYPSGLVVDMIASLPLFLGAIAGSYLGGLIRRKV